MRRHIQEEHQDILWMKRRTRQDPGANLSTDEFEPDVCPPESAKLTHGEVRFPGHQVTATTFEPPCRSHVCDGNDLRG